MAGANWSLPTKAEIGGRVYRLNTDYRDVLEIIGYLQEEKSPQAAVHIALALFYEEYDDLPPRHWREALDYLTSFLACFEQDDGKPHPKLIDWEQDYTVIVADINKVAGTEVRALEYMHWFTFIAFFNSIGEGQLSTLVSIRQKVQKRKKLEKWEQEFYRQNRHKVDFRTKYTPEELAEQARWKERLGR